VRRLRILWRIRSRLRPWLVATSLLAAALTLAACAGEENAGATFRPSQPGVLKVATAFLPAPGFWQGSPPTSGGFEAALASALAKHLGLKRVEVVKVPFGDLVHGRLGGADIGLSQVTPTAERKSTADFSTPYLSAPPGILARPGVSALDEKGLRELRWVASRTSALTPILLDHVRPNDAPTMVEDRTAALDVLRSGRAEALLLDLPVALGIARADPRQYHVIGQLDNDNDLSAVLPNGSDNLEVVDSAIRALTANGTIDRLESRWLGESEGNVPLILTQ
jgi:polar amino acid transport system substrate-binding protein